MKLHVMALLISISFTVPASAQAFSTEDMANACTAEHFSFNSGICLGFVRGFVAAHSLFVEVKNAPRIFCLPERGASFDQIIKVFVKWAKIHPEHLHRDARVTIPVALHSTFPCQAR